MIGVAVCAFARCVVGFVRTTSVDGVLRAVGLVPSPPLLVPELTGAGVPEVAPVRTAALAAAAMLASQAERWLVLGSADAERTIAPSGCGSFAGFGVDVSVELSPHSDRFDPQLPLAALIAGWLRGRVAPESTIEVRLVDRAASLTDCFLLGRELRAELDASSVPYGLLAVADGATTLTVKAPGSYDERAEAVQQRIDDALGSADPSLLADLDPAVCDQLGIDGLAVWHTLTGVLGGERPRTRTLYRGAPFGVGYFVGTWELVCSSEERV